MKSRKKDGPINNLNDTSHGSDFLIAGGNKTEDEWPLTDDNVEGSLHCITVNQAI